MEDLQTVSGQVAFVWSRRRVLRGLFKSPALVLARGHIKAQRAGLLYVSVSSHVFVKSRLITDTVACVG